MTWKKQMSVLKKKPLKAITEKNVSVRFSMSHLQRNVSRSPLWEPPMSKVDFHHLRSYWRAKMWTGASSSLPPSPGVWNLHNSSKDICSSDLFSKWFKYNFVPIRVTWIYRKLQCNPTSDTAATWKLLSRRSLSHFKTSLKENDNWFVCIHQNRKLTWIQLGILFDWMWNRVA